MPPDVREWLPAGHLAWGLLGLAGELDLAPFTCWYRADGQGRPAYHPAVMVTLICYCFCKGIVSSRGIEAATFDDVGARVICGNLHPDHSTVHRFITRHEDAVRGLLAASVMACARQGLVSVDVVAGDGTKVRASASMGRNVTLAQLDEQIAGLEQEVAAQARAWVEQVLAADAQAELPGAGGDDDDDDGGGAGGGGRKAAAAREMLGRRRQARQQLEAREQQRQQEAQAGQQERAGRLEVRAARCQAAADALAAAADAKARAWQQRAADKAASGSRKSPDGRKPAAAKDNAHVRRARQAAEKARQELGQARSAAPPEPGKPLKINSTDPSSMVMPAKNGGFGQLHNVQAVACRSSQVILAIGTHPSPVDTAALHPALRQARATLDAAGISDTIGKALFDAGYASDTNFTAACEADLYVAVTKEARQAGRLRDGRKPVTRKGSWQKMAAKLATPDGKTLCKQRSATIEPVFAQLFARLGTHLNYRGERVATELSLWGTSHNFLKALRARTTQPGQLAPAA